MTCQWGKPQLDEVENGEVRPAWSITNWWKSSHGPERRWYECLARRW
ncbi:MAG: hypothetical protein J7M32_03315 [Deltaproteobacteria bacterium]|nr:hypothetical protein [Deltaproteobacteria bacterium]